MHGARAVWHSPVAHRDRGHVAALPQVVAIRGQEIAPKGVPVFNPAFDVTPAKYLTGVVTEEGVCYPPFAETLPRAKRAAEEHFRKVREAAPGRGSPRSLVGRTS